MTKIFPVKYEHMAIKELKQQVFFFIYKNILLSIYNLLKIYDNMALLQQTI